MRKFFRISFYFGVTALFVVVALIGFTQTRYFRAYLRSLILKSYPEYIKASLEFEKIEGNLVTGTMIHNIALQKDSVEVFAAERIEVKYDPTGFLFGRVPLNRITLINPRIHVWRGLDGSWNVDRIVVPRATDSTASSTIIDLKNIELVNATISYVDSLALSERQLRHDEPPPDEAIDYARVELSSFNLTADARIEPRKVSAEIRKLSFLSRRPGFSLARLSGNFSLTSSLVVVNNLVVETKNSAMKADVQLKNIDITKVRKLEEFQRAPVQVNLDIQKLDMRELKQFLYPHIDFLDRSASLQLQASGTFGRLSVDRLTLKTPKSLVQAQGILSNLHHPQDLELEIACIDNKVDPKDITELMPGLHLPDLRFLGETSYNLAFSGAPTDFAVHLNAETDPGLVQLNGSLKIQQSLQYKATVAAQDVDLGLILQDDKFRSRIGGTVTIDGTGTNLRTMRTVARMEIDTSSVMDLPMNRSVIVCDVSDGNLRSHMTMALGSAACDVSGKIQFQKDSTVYELDGKIGSLDLGQILRDASYESDLTMRLNGNGAWLDGSRLRSQMFLRMARSSFNKLPIDSAVVRAEYDTRDTTLQSIRIASDIGEVTAEGRLTLGGIVGNLRDGAGILVKAMEYRIRNLDSLRAFAPVLLPAVPRFHGAIGSNPEYTDAHVDVRIRDLYPLGVFFHQRIRGDLAMKLVVRGDIDDMSMTGEAAAGDLQYNSPSLDVFSQNTRVAWDLAGISRDSILTQLTANLDVASRASQINNVGLSNLALSLRMKGHEGAYTLSMLVDSTADVHLGGNYLYRNSVYAVECKDLKVGFGPAVYENSDPVNFILGKDGTHIRSFSIRHETEELNLTGFFNPAGVSDVDISVKGFLLGNLRTMIRPLKQPPILRNLGGIVSGKALLRGTFDYPNLSLDLVADGVRFGETVLGQIESRLSYFDHVLTVDGSYRYNSTSSTPDMMLKGTLPYELSLTSAHTHQLSGQIDLTLEASGVRMDLFSPLIPVVSNLSGSLSCDMKMKGTMDSPEYDGYISLSSARFVFLPLNIQYILDGRFVSNKSNIALRDVTVKNIEQDQAFAKGLMNISGNFTLQGLKLGAFDLVANGQLLLMKEISRPAGAKFYGDLFAATGLAGIRWNGTLARSYLSGEVDIKNGRITLPPERETVFLANKNISIVFKDDTSKAKPSSQNRNEVQESVSPLLAVNDGGRPVNGSQPGSTSAVTPPSRNAEEEQTASFLDNIVYDLIIDTQGPTQLRLIVNPITNEELFADLKGRLAFEKRGPQARLNGEVEVGSRSYYNYFKRFDATGKLQFTGNPLNPELNIVGKYEGIHRILAVSESDTSRPSEQKVLVTLEITGTRNEPKLKFGLEEEKNRKYEKKEGGDVESDAIAFLLSGQYRDELTRAQRAALIGENLIGITSGVLSAPLREYLRKETGVSLDVLYYGGASFEQSTDIRLSGEIGAAVVRFGGRVFNNINNTNVSVELPMSSILGTETWRNLVLTLERRVEGLETLEETRSSRGARLLYRINF